MAEPLVTETPYGVLCVSPILAEAKADLLSTLHPDEAALAASWGEARVRTFAAGRRALRALLTAQNIAWAGPILRDDRGAPMLPSGVRASVSHKDEIVAALMTTERMDPLGVDIETLPGPSMDVQSHVLTPRERAELAALPEDARRAELVLRFSYKEALYKALDPFVRRYVGFLEVEVRADAHETAQFDLSLKNGEGPFHVEGRHRRVPGAVITMVRVASR